MGMKFFSLINCVGVAFLRDAAMLPGIDYASSSSSSDVVTSYGVVTVGRLDSSSLAADTLKVGQGEKGFVSNLAYEISKHRCYERELDGLTAKVAY